MLRARRLALTLTLLLSGTSLAAAQQCGGDFSQFLDGVRAEALAKGLSPAAVDTALAGMRIDQKVLAADRAQGVFAQDWQQFATRMVNGHRLTQGKANLQKYASVLAQVEAETGVPGPVIAAFWGLETDYGAVLGNFDTLAALATLAHDCRRPELFRPHLIGAIEIVDRGYLTPSEMKGAWAGEIGQTQLLPEEYIAFGTDGDGNGRVDLRKDAADVLVTTGKYIQSLGWRGGEPWLEAVRVPADFPWDRAALVNKEPRSSFAALGVARADGSPLPADELPAALILPMGRGGPAFLAYPNFDIYLKWNKSLVYSLTAAYFSTRLAGVPPIDMGNPQPGLDLDQTKRLQQRLVELGHDVGGVDGILGENTRSAVRREQQRLGLPADGWPTRDLLSAL
ncbi:lytic murein transglycosylase [Aurantimonas sp. C2-6-R+9]|uniref:lytic murein transglycosylase n=1 Tax=unclassified Aurantimonas TaxID=2638230 RepID=UPI002E196419|nr:MULTISPECIES: lytic murein transglycosylase [unclassified Aurantimonas]MEC5290055.1 lytic murein transglycosylase [Aurantimonas sp. C2-3-R2]MEC5381819.1 lytic murein transglycosylase [Aurantimonas sp. C2-6-R+9]MEC5411120.1 lytic murein transglycosylase [Aurantimonas sp. C2-4-R8]